MKQRLLNTTAMIGVNSMNFARITYLPPLLPF